MFCPNCGYQLEDDADFCDECGFRIPRAQPTQAVQTTQPMQPAQPTRVAQTPQPGLQPPVQPARPSQQPSTGNGGQRRRSKLPIVIAVLVTAVVVAVVCLYVVPLFISHPVDPHVHTALTSDPVASQMTSGATSTGASTSSAPSANSTSPTSLVPTPTSTSDTAVIPPADPTPPVDSTPPADTPPTETTPPQTTPPTPTFPSTDMLAETLTLGDFLWLSGEAAKGNVPEGATRITDLGAITGGWKGYMFGSNMEWFLTADIEVGQNDILVTCDWLYVMNGSTGEGQDDNTPNTTYAGTWSDGTLDALGTAHVTLVAFWEQDGHQYATGSFVWADNSTCTIALTRP